MKHDSGSKPARSAPDLRMVERDEVSIYEEPSEETSHPVHNFKKEKLSTTDNSPSPKLLKTSNGYWSSFCLSSTKNPSVRKVYRFKEGNGTFTVIKTELLEEEGHTGLFSQINKKMGETNVTQKVESNVSENEIPSTETKNEDKTQDEVSEVPPCLVQSEVPICGCTVPCRLLISKLYNLQQEPNNEDMPQILVSSRRAMILTGPAKILPWLFLGDKYHAMDDILLERKKVRVVMNCTRDVPNYFPDGFVYHQFLLDDNDNEDISIHFGDAFVKLESAREKGENVLVHCRAGISRSATIVLAYLMMHKKWSLIESWKRVQMIRTVQPNKRFSQSLLDLEFSLFRTSSMKFFNKKPYLFDINEQIES